MRSVKIVLAAGLALTAVVVVVVLSHAPSKVVAGNAVAAQSMLELEHGGVGSCQPARMLPRGTSALRIAIEARAVGPAVSVRVLSGSRVITEGHRPAGWGSAPTVTVPVRPLAHEVTGVRICVGVGQTVEPLRVHGTLTGHPTAGGGELGRMTLRMEYLRPGRKSWWSLASSVAHHMGVGRAPSGTWVGFLALALMLAVAVLASRLALRDLR
jgi:hypothetical protein